MIFHYMFFGSWVFVLSGIIIFMILLSRLDLLNRYGNKLINIIIGSIGILSILGICSILETFHILP